VDYQSRRIIQLLQTSQKGVPLMASSSRYRIGNAIGFTVFIGLITIVAALAYAGDNQITSGDGDDAVEIKELGASIVATSDGLRVVGLTQADKRTEKYQAVDIKMRDRIVSINGKNVATVAELRAILSGLKAGDQVRLGSLRSSGPVVAEYTVASEQELKAVRLASQECNLIVNNKGDDKSGRKMTMINVEEGSIPCLELGAVFTDIKGQVTVSQVIPITTHKLPVQLAEGDVIKSIQGEKVIRAADLISRYATFKVGDSVTLVIEKAGKENRLTYAKPEISKPVFYKTK
jgi:S1-C subfamily serine protease